MGWPILMHFLLDGGAITILKHMKVNGKDDIPYMKWNITHVPNHQAVNISFCGAHDDQPLDFGGTNKFRQSLFEGAPTYKNSPNLSLHTPWIRDQPKESTNETGWPKIPKYSDVEPLFIEGPKIERKFLFFSGKMDLSYLSDGVFHGIPRAWRMREAGICRCGGMFITSRQYGNEKNHEKQWEYPLVNVYITMENHHF